MGWKSGAIWGTITGAVIYLVMIAFSLMSGNPTYQSIVYRVWYQNIPSFLGFCAISLVIGAVVGKIRSKK
ncbi:MAG: hypothetical protein WCK90_03745 [archaeon]